ncbi:MAG TPA: GNAT family N-acetyltransferase [Acidiphilium sp.]|nr:GNAT family N-acetyltransferase [Acidiphilium sp.]
MDIIFTSRLVLRTPLSSDLQHLHDHVLSDTDVMKMAFAGASMSFQQSISFFEANFDHAHTGRKLGILVERDTSAFVGFAGLLPCNVLNQPDYECGFVLRRAVWGRGYATEIGRGQIEYGLEKLQLNRLLAQASPQNRGSISVLEKLGMEFKTSIQTAERGERHVYAIDRLPPLRREMLLR